MNCKIIQSGLDNTSEREVLSMEQLKSLGLRYIRIENQPYDRPAPLNNIYKNWVNFYRGSQKENNETGLTDRHYGAWLSHKQAILLSFADDDYSLICECDCRILDIDLFKERLSEAIKVLEENPKYPIVRFEPISYSLDKIDVKFGDQISRNLYDEDGWTTPDDWLWFTFIERQIPFLCFKEDLTSQFSGYSQIDKLVKNY